jgi:hypothetical protein
MPKIKVKKRKQDFFPTPKKCQHIREKNPSILFNTFHAMQSNSVPGRETIMRLHCLRVAARSVLSFFRPPSSPLLLVVLITSSPSMQCRYRTKSKKSKCNEKNKSIEDMKSEEEGKDKRKLRPKCNTDPTSIHSRINAPFPSPNQSIAQPARSLARMPNPSKSQIANP